MLDWTGILFIKRVKYHNIFDIYAQSTYMHTVSSKGVCTCEKYTYMRDKRQLLQPDSYTCCVLFERMTCPVTLSLIFLHCAHTP